MRKVVRVAVSAGLGWVCLAAPGEARQAVPVPAARDSLSFQGVFSDTAFAGTASLRLEVLETGDTLAVTPGREFRLRLPLDTLWNLCFSGKVPVPRAMPGDSAPRTAPGDSAGEPATLEKCFELRYTGAGTGTGGDTAFSAALGEGPAALVLAPQAEAATEISATADSAAEEEEAGPFRPEDAVQLKKVTVRAQRAPKRSLGKSTVSAKLIKRLPGLAEADVIRSIQALPGVVASSDFSTKIYVRGGGSDQNLILLDKAVVYSPVHFFGLFSTFLVEGIDDLTFYKGGFPPEYGNRLSSVLDIKSRKGGKDTVDTWVKGSSVKISTFASQAHTEGRRGDFRWLLAGRKTYFDEMLTLLRRLDATELDIPYTFYDWQGSAAYEVGPDRDFLLSFYQGRDILNFGVFQVEWGNTVIPLNMQWRISEDWMSRSTASYSLFSQSFGLTKIFSLYNRIATWNQTQHFEYAGLSDHQISLGWDMNFMQTIFANSNEVVKLRLRDYTGFYLSNVFAQDKWTVGNTEWTSGARVSHSSRLAHPYLEPRMSVKQRLPAGQSLDFHTGYYVQYINSISFQDQENLNEFYYPAKEVTFQTVNPTTSILFSAGYGVEKIRGQWDFTLEGYYKTLNHLLIFAPDEAPDSVRSDTRSELGDFFKEANGYSFGFEISLRRPEGLIFGGLSYSNGTSVIREDRTNLAYWPRWHQPHSFKGDLAINWRGKDGIWNSKKPGRFFRSSTSLKYATGLPFTEEIGYMPSHLIQESPGRSAGGPNPEFNGNLNTIRGNRNAAFVPPYLRWDAKVVDWGKEGKWAFAFTILNLTDHKNIFLYTYDRQSNPPVRTEFTQFPFFPLLFNYEYNF